MSDPRRAQSIARLRAVLEAAEAFGWPSEAGSQGDPFAFRGGDADERRTPADAAESRVALVVVRDPAWGVGTRQDAFVSVAEETAPGATDVALRIRPLGIPHVDGMQRTLPVTGRFLLEPDLPFDFLAASGSTLDPTGDAWLLRARLGGDWVDRDASARDLVAGLRAVLIVVDGE